MILAHGVWSDYRIWEPLYQNLLTSSHSYNWKAFLVGKNAREGVMDMGNLGYTKYIFDNADQLARYVKYAQKETNAWHVDMVAHQMGGLVARVYAQKRAGRAGRDARRSSISLCSARRTAAQNVSMFLPANSQLLKDELHVATGTNEREYAYL